jgi:pimeloyl-ACP methyl ester carboxylesterase
MSACPSASELGPAIDGERRRWRPRWVGLGHVSLYVAERRRGRPLVLVHDLGLASSAYEVRPLFESFRWRRPTYALDLPGFGLSDRAQMPYTPVLFAFVLAELLRTLRRADLAADVVALGRGVEVAVRAARDEPGLVRSLVMVEPAGLLPASRSVVETVAGHLVRLLGDAAARGIYAMLANRRVVGRSLRARFRGAPDPGLVAYSAASARVAGAYRAPLASCAYASRPLDAAALFRAVAVPVLVVHDVAGPSAVALEAFLRGRANRFAVRISPTRGMPQFEKRAETVAALDRFWQSLPRAACERAMR